MESFTGNSSNKSTADLVISLLDKSLIQQLPESHGENRFNMLMMIRQFSLEKLRNSGKESEARDGHLAYFLKLADEAGKEIHGVNQLEWMEKIEREHANFQIALEWSISNQKIELALRLLGALGWVWWLRGHYSESREWFDRIRKLPGLSDHPVEYARLLNRIGCQSWNIAENQDAIALLQESQVIWLALGEEGERGLADCLNWMGIVIFYSDADLSKAGSYVELSLALYQKHKDVWGVAHAMLHMGIITQTGVSPLVWFEQSLGLFEQAGDRWGMSQVYQCMGRVYLDKNNYEKARWCFEQQMSIDGSLHYISGIINGLCDMGNIHLHQGDHAQAREFYEQSLVTCRAHGLKPDRNPMFCLGILALYQDNYSLARKWFVELFNSIGGMPDVSDVRDLLSGLAAVAAGTNQPERAAKLYGILQGIFEATGFHYPRSRQTEFDRQVQIAKSHLGDDLFETIANESRLMTMEQAVVYALETGVG